MIFRTLEEYCQVKAIQDNLRPDEWARWEKYCRGYSRTFHTPLVEVYKLDPEHILYSYYANEYDDADLEENIENVLEFIYKIEDPEYNTDLQKESGVQEYLAKYEAEKAKKKASKKALPEKQKETPKKESIGGSVDFSSLNDEEKPGKF